VPCDRWSWREGITYTMGSGRAKAAGIEKLEGGLWHTYRRKWATERKDLPLKDVATAGGWKDVTTLLTCNQHADEATMLKVMESPLPGLVTLPSCGRGSA